MGMSLRKFQLSCKYVSGFTCNIDLTNHNCMESVIIEIKEILRTILETYNLHKLLKFLKYTNYHYHNYTFADVRKQNKTFVICNHCETFNLII